MILKTFGVIVLLSGSLYLCFSFSVFERRRLAQCEGFLLLLRHIRAQISCYRMPLGRIWSSFACEELTRCGFLPKLCECGSFLQALEASRQKIWLCRDEMNLLTAFGSELGHTYASEQLNCCEYYIGELEKAYAARREQEPSRSKLYRSLFVTGALMIVIILI